ncbi:MAG: hypothetical protein C3F02_02710 [Parcubacteria group bacterium]|nr:MAG: hypothetical protein C3F02_02710 [Parcubacteria group bacterium]
MDKKFYNSRADSSATYDPNFEARFGRSRKQRRRKSSWFFILVAIVILVLGLAYIYNNIIGAVGYKLPSFITDQIQNSQQAISDEQLKKTDTDQDGLTDYQELYQYHTSIFLPDTDSDGYSDFDEATKGDDPLCPRGQNCNLLALITPKTKLAEVIQDVTLDPTLTFQDAVVAEFRKFLIDSGIPKEQVDQLTNDDLVVLMDALANSGLLDSVALSATTTPAEIRQFLLVQPNASADEINKLSDEDLLKIRDKILAQ